MSVGWCMYGNREAAQPMMEVRFPGPLALLRRLPVVSLSVADSLFELWE